MLGLHTPLLTLIAGNLLTANLFSCSQVEKALGLHEKGGPLYHVQPACAIIGEGLEEGLDTLYEMICKRKKSNKQCGKNSKKRWRRENAWNTC